MSSLFALRALLFAGECLLASSAIFAVAWIAQRWLARASLRHLVWLTAFALMVAFPLAALVVPGAIVIPIAEPALLTAVPVGSVATASVLGAPAEATQLPAFDPQGVALLLFALWFAGFAWQMARLALAAHALRTLRLASRPHSLAPAAVPRVDFRGRECELRIHAGGEGPMTWGFRHAIVLLPEAARHWSAGRLEAVLLHELAHVRRRDSLSQSLARLVAAFYWINPLVIWLGLRALTREAEIASDDAVLGFGVRPSAYASELVRLASEFRGHRLAVSGVSMASPSALAARVDSVLATNRSRKGATRIDIVKLATLGFAATALLALAHPALGSEPVPPVPPVPAAPAVAPAPPVEPVAPVPPAPPVPPRDVTVHHGHVILLDGDSAADRAELHRAMARMHAEMQRIRPEIEKAMADARVQEKVARAMAGAHIEENIQRAMADAHVHEKIEQAMAKVHDAQIDLQTHQAMMQAAMRQAMADAHIHDKIAKALHDAQPAIDAAMAKAAHHRGHMVIIERDDDQDGDTKVGDDAGHNDEDRTH